MKCSNCNNIIPKESKICPICGTIFATYFEDRILTKKQIRILFLHKMFFWIIIIIPIIIISGILLINYNKKINIIKENVVKENSEIYDSTEKYYKYILNKKEKEIYDIILEKINNYEETIELDLNNYNIEPQEFRLETLKNIKHVLSMDHPELIQLGTINIYETENNKTKLIINYTIQKNNLEEAKTKLKNEIEKIKENTKEQEDEEKIKYVYDYMLEIEKEDEKSTEYYSAYSCMILKKCNIYGYAKAAQLLLTNINISSMLVTGTLSNKYHEWNIVKLENKYYNYDPANRKIYFKENNYIPYHKNVIPNTEKK